MSGCRERRAAAGFTLIEVLVALAILGVVLSAVLRLFGSGTRQVAAIHDRVQLATLAESLLERSRTDLAGAAAVSSGRLPDGVSWEIRRTPYQEERPAVIEDTEEERGRFISRAEDREEQEDRADRSGDRGGRQGGASAGMGSAGAFAGGGSTGEASRPALRQVTVLVTGGDGRNFRLDSLELVPARR